VFSAGLPPPVVAAVLAGLDLLEKEPERLDHLRHNIRYAAKGLRELGHECQDETPIISLRVPPSMNLYDAAHQFHEAGLFVNALAYPAVPPRQQRFRISLMADHSASDIDRLLEAVQEIWWSLPNVDNGGS
jgi:7-keto-8-aminopelargonate synthetase-like enzyme